MREATVTLSDGRVLGYAEHGDPEGAPIIYNHPLPGARNFNLEEPALRAAAARSFTWNGRGLACRSVRPGARSPIGPLTWRNLLRLWESTALPWSVYRPVDPMRCRWPLRCPSE
jgi:hypothetical protein